MLANVECRPRPQAPQQEDDNTQDVKQRSSYAQAQRYPGFARVTGNPPPQCGYQTTCVDHQFDNEQNRNPEHPVPERSLQNHPDPAEEQDTGAEYQPRCIDPLFRTSGTHSQERFLISNHD